MNKAAFKGRRKERGGGGEGHLHFKGYELFRLGLECLICIMITGLLIIRSKKKTGAHKRVDTTEQSPISTTLQNVINLKLIYYKVHLLR